MKSQIHLCQADIPTEILVFKTNLATKKRGKAAGHILNQNSSIVEWSIDMEDIDNVLRIVTSGNISEYQIIKMLRTNGFLCEILLD
ncbi:hypothetical protein SAMN04488029_0404 [Reichenbachiella faecimaris]|uniref:Copper chaperone CopZ n=1 Tax=Reichenbachiella faecimaris TaxID=692418 RepID=A0A1W2G6Y3_REIFA|nr:hypothetical protein [Reichenbachiella faecimaris]SMD32066.1 hypothetical protein SAMN04488029_0404 [Reichenbachiella faecimaris]